MEAEQAVLERLAKNHDEIVRAREDWESGFGRAIGVFLNGDGIRERAAAAGGTVVWEDNAPGTRLVVTLPTGAAA